MLFPDFLATLPPVSSDCYAVDRQARRTGAARDPFGTPTSRVLATRLVGEFEQTQGVQDLSETDWRELVVNLRDLSPSEWAVLRKREPTTPSTDPVEPPVRAGRRRKAAGE
jgi:hypothetical protein